MAQYPKPFFRSARGLWYVQIDGNPTSPCRSCSGVLPRSPEQPWPRESLILAAWIILAALWLAPVAIILVAPLASGLARFRMGLIVLLRGPLAAMALLTALGLFGLLH